MTLPAEIYLIETVRRLLDGTRHVAIGANSPIPAAAALLARRLGSGAARISMQQFPRFSSFTDGGRELFDLAGQGRLDAFFLSGAQIDGQGNINLVAVGDYAAPRARFPGSWGSGLLYFAVPRVILFRSEHSRRSLVEKVDFISAPGTSPPGVWRRGGPVALVTPLCAFAFADGGFRLASLHPGHTLEEVRDQTGFAFACPETVPETPAPSDEALALLRDEVAPLLADLYPAFHARVFAQ
jgi:glutaconate CoA-transferase subunit B